MATDTPAALTPEQRSEIPPERLAELWAFADKYTDPCLGYGSGVMVNIRATELSALLTECDRLRESRHAACEDLAAVRAECDRLRGEVERLTEENSECRAFASTADQMVKDAEQRIAALTAERDAVESKRCPVCGLSPMKSLDVEGTEARYCLNCIHAAASDAESDGLREWMDIANEYKAELQEAHARDEQRVEWQKAERERDAALAAVEAARREATERAAKIAKDEARRCASDLELDPTLDGRDAAARIAAAILATTDEGKGVAS